SLMMYPWTSPGCSASSRSTSTLCIGGSRPCSSISCGARKYYPAWSLNTRVHICGFVMVLFLSVWCPGSAGADSRLGRCADRPLTPFSPSPYLGANRVEVGEGIEADGPGEAGGVRGGRGLLVGRAPEHRVQQRLLARREQGVQPLQLGSE